MGGYLPESFVKKNLNFVQTLHRSRYLGVVESKSIFAKLYVGNATCFNCPLSSSPITLHHVIFCLICLPFCFESECVIVCSALDTWEGLKCSSLRHLSACQNLDQYEYRFLLTSFMVSWSPIHKTFISLCVSMVLKLKLTYMLCKTLGRVC